MNKQIISSAMLATLALTACGGGSDSEGAAAETTVEAVAETEAPEVAPPTTEAAPATTEAAPPTTEAAPPTTEAPSVDLNFDTAGPTVCIDKIIEHLGPDAMVNEISSHFETGIDDDGEDVVGKLFICDAFYQDPTDPIKLLGIQMDTDTGEISEPGEVDINFTGDASEFDLNDYVIKASDINTSIVQPKMDEENPALAEKYSEFRWSRVSLVAPGPFSDVHVFDLRMEGLLAQNGLTEDGYTTIAMDGTVIIDHLDD